MFGKKKTNDDVMEEVDYTPKKEMGKGMKIAGGIFIAILLLSLFFGSFYSIKEEEQAVVTTFGRARAVTTPGLHFKIPVIQKVYKINTTIQGFPIGYTGDNNDESIDSESLMITSDYNFINIDFYVEYRLSDPVRVLYASQEPVEILKNLSQNCIRTVVGSYTVDAVLTTGKNEIQGNIKEMIMEKLENLDIGVQLVNITIQDAEPPTAEVINAFKAVETAKQGKATALNNANKYRNEQIPAAEAVVDQIKQSAEAQKQQRINEANGQVARFNAMYAEYTKFPFITKQRMFYEAMEDVLPNLKVVIEGEGEIQEFLPLDSIAGEAGTNEKATKDTQDKKESDAKENTGKEDE